MAFIIQKKSYRSGKENDLFYFVENYREGNKIRRKTIFRMGQCPDLYEYLALMGRREEAILNDIDVCEKKLKIVLEKLKMYPGFPFLMDQKMIWTQRLNETKAQLDECHQIQQQIQTYM